MKNMWDEDYSTLSDDIDITNWREYLGDITTDALWLSGSNTSSNSRKFDIPTRDFLPTNSSKFHGLWIPEIPYQFIRRFTKKNEVVWSVFGGSGTDYRVAELLDRECIINDLNPQEDFIVQGDSRTFNPGKEVDLALVHPPYHDIVTYSEKNPSCGSTQDGIVGFLKWFKEVSINIDTYLKKDGIVILACGNVYNNSEEIPLGLYTAQVFQALGYTLKSHIIKDYGETKGTEGKNYNVNYYRQLKGGYNNFYGDNIFILKKTKSKNDFNEILKAITD